MWQCAFKSNRKCTHIYTCARTSSHRVNASLAAENLLLYASKMLCNTHGTKHTCTHTLKQTHSHTVTHLMIQSVAALSTVCCVCLCVWVCNAECVIKAASGLSLQQLISIKTVFHFLFWFCVWIKSELRQFKELHWEIINCKAESGFCHSAFMCKQND